MKHKNKKQVHKILKLLDRLPNKLCTAKETNSELENRSEEIDQNLPQKDNEREKKHQSQEGLHIKVSHTCN